MVVLVQSVMLVGLVRLVEIRSDMLRKQNPQQLDLRSEIKIRECVDGDFLQI